MAAVAPLVVIAPAYCTPSETGYVLQEKGCILAGYFDITDTIGFPTFKLQRRVLSLQRKKVLLDMALNPVAVIRMKKIYAGDGDTLLASVKRKVLTMKFQANVIVHRFGDEPYLKVKADSLGSKNLKVLRGETVVATVSRRNWLGPSRYDLVVSANVDQAFCVALTVVLDVILND